MLTSASVCFLVAGALGVLSYFYLGGWVGGWDMYHRAADEAEKLTAQSVIAREGKRIAKSQKFLLGAFFFGMTFGALFCLVYLWCPAPQPRAAQLLLATDGTIWQIAAEQDQTLKAWRVPRALPTQQPASAVPGAGSAAPLASTPAPAQTASGAPGPSSTAPLASTPAPAQSAVVPAPARR